jgi:catechol 2,3-dioxygenase-like lactoylglutathione lyase family enzyme
MQIKLTSVFVDDQDKALKFYTEVLGFQKKMEFQAGTYKWLTVVSAEEPEGVQLVLEHNGNPAAKTYQQEIFRQGIPAANFFVGGRPSGVREAQATRRDVHQGANQDYGIDHRGARRYLRKSHSDHTSGLVTVW